MSSEPKLPHLFEQAPVSLWLEDYTVLIRRLDELVEQFGDATRVQLKQDPELQNELMACIKVTDVNKESLLLFETERKQALLSGLQSTFTAQAREAFVDEIQNILKGELTHDIQTEVRTFKGNVRDVKIRYHIQQDDSGQADYSRVLVSFTDITSLQSDRRELLRDVLQKSRYLNLANVHFLSLDVEGSVTSVNTKLCHLLSSSQNDLVGQPWYETLVHSEDRVVAKRHFWELTHGASSDEVAEYRIVSSSGQALVVEWFHSVLRDPDGKIQEIVLSGTDHTREREIEAQNQEMELQLRQTQKLNALSTLARGVAHEINNPLMGILNYATLLHDELEENDELRAFAAGIGEEGGRVKKIVSNLLSFARPDLKAKQEVRILNVIEDSLLLMRKTLDREGIHLELNLDVETEIMSLQVQEVQHVLINGLTNAMEAIQDRSDPSESGKVTLSARPEYRSKLPGVRISIEDNGIGIPQEHLERVLEPFYVVSGSHRRMGMGLAIIYGIVRDHGGDVQLHSTTKVGTELVIWLPTIIEP